MNRQTLINFVPVKRRVKLEFRGKCTSCPWKLKGCHVYTPQATIDEERALGQAYKGPRHEGPVSVRIDVFRALPGSRPKRVLGEPDTMTPDIDNIAKAVLDGLNGIAYDDDKQVVELHVYKHDRERRLGDSVRISVEGVTGA